MHEQEAPGALILFVDIRSMTIGSLQGEQGVLRTSLTRLVASLDWFVPSLLRPPAGLMRHGPFVGSVRGSSLAEELATMAINGPHAEV